MPNTTSSANPGSSEWTLISTELRHDFMENPHGPPKCGHCGLLLAEFEEASVKEPCCVPDRLRPSKSQPDESDEYVAYHADSYAVKFYKSESEVNMFLQSDADGRFGGTNRDNRWQGPIPILAPHECNLHNFDWRTLTEFLDGKDISANQRLSIRQKIRMTLDGQDPEPTCFLRSSDGVLANTKRRSGHQYIGGKDTSPARLLAHMWRDLLSEYQVQFPNATARSVSDFMTNVDVFRHLRERANEMADDDGHRARVETKFSGEYVPSVIDDSLDFILRQLCAKAYEIRTAADAQCSHAPASGRQQNAAADGTAMAPAQSLSAEHVPEQRDEKDAQPDADHAAAGVQETVAVQPAPVTTSEPAVSLDAQPHESVEMPAGNQEMAKAPAPAEIEANESTGDRGERCTTAIPTSPQPPAELESIEVDITIKPQSPQAAATTAERSAPTVNREAMKAERKALRDAYRAECRRAGIKLTDAMISEKACEKWTTRDPVQKWIACDPRYEGGPDRLIRRVLTQKPHLHER